MYETGRFGRSKLFLGLNILVNYGWLSVMGSNRGLLQLIIWLYHIYVYQVPGSFHFFFAAARCPYTPAGKLLRSLTTIRSKSRLLKQCQIYTVYIYFVFVLVSLAFLLSRDVNVFE